MPDTSSVSEDVLFTHVSLLLLNPAEKPSVVARKDNCNHSPSSSNQQPHSLVKRPQELGGRDLKTSQVQDRCLTSSHVSPCSAALAVGWDREVP